MEDCDPFSDSVISTGIRLYSGRVADRCNRGLPEGYCPDDGSAEYSPFLYGADPISKDSVAGKFPRPFVS